MDSRAAHLLATVLLIAACTDGNSSDGSQCNGKPVGDICVEFTQSEVMGNPCTQHVDCKNLAACIEGTCGKQCEEPNDWQCGTDGKVCYKWQCLNPNDVPTGGTSGSDAVSHSDPGGNGESCSSNMDCGGKAACIDGSCQKQCDQDSDCGNADEWDCKQFQCFSTKPQDVQTADEGTPKTDPGKPEDTKTPAEDTTSTNPKCTSKKAPYGATCYCKEDCLSTLCLGDIAAGKGFCTEECFTSNNCQGNDWCYASPDGVKVCVKNDAGAPCAQGCLSSITLTNQQGACVCTVPCDSASQCPGTMACSTVNLGSNPIKVCVPIGPLCNPQGAVPCYGTCYPDLNNNFFCTASCTSLTDCPTGFSCCPETLGGQFYQNCLPKCP
jgi:hypothetical protein